MNLDGIVTISEHLLTKLKPLSDQKKFPCILPGFLLITILSLILSENMTKSFIFGGSIVIICFGIMSRKHLFGELKNKKYNLEVLGMVCYFAIMFIHCYSDVEYFSNSKVNFCFGYLCAFCERLISSRIKRRSSKILFSIFIAIIRAQVIPINDRSVFLLQSLCLFQTLFSDLDKFKNQSDKFKNIIDQGFSQGVVILSQDIKKCHFANNTFKALIGESLQDICKYLDRFSISNSSVTSLELMEFSSTSETLTKFLTRSVLSKKNIQCNVTYRNPSRLNQENVVQFQTFEVQINNVSWEQQIAVLLTFRQIEQQHYESTQRKGENQKESVLATVSHELRTPLNSMLGVVQIMQNHVKDQELVHYLDICNNSGHLLLAWINSILDFNQMRFQRIKLDLEIFDLQNLLKSVIKLFEYSCTQKGISLKSKFNANTPKYIKTDKNRLRQIFIHIVGNALKYTNKGGIIIEVNNSFNRDFIEFSIEDTGCGISEEDKERLFTPSDQLNLEELGLGLTISQGLVKILGGDFEDIKLESEQGKGSKFTFCIRKGTMRETQYERLDISEFSENYSGDNETIDTVGGVNKKMQSYSTLSIKRHPTYERCATLETQQASRRHSENPFVQGIELNKRCITDYSLREPQNPESLPKKIFASYVLVVDDNPLNIMIAEHLIGLKGCGVKTSLSGNEAIDLLLSNDHFKEPIKLILMDIQMPVMDGYQTTRILNKLMEDGRMPRIPIAALTANDTENDKEASREAGMRGHLSKPLKALDLSKILKQYCMIE